MARMRRSKSSSSGIAFFLCIGGGENAADRRRRGGKLSVCPVYPTAMIDHVELTVSDLSLSSPFFTAALAPLGYRQVHAAEIAGFGTNDAPADFWIRPGGPS